MSRWPATKARRVLAALLRIGWSIKRQSGSHRTLERAGWPDFGIDELLRAQKLREQPAPHDETASHGSAGELPVEKVAAAAYLIWLQEGCPHGRDTEHWSRAEKELRRQRRMG
jgi:hypothetical protein